MLRSNLAKRFTALLVTLSMLGSYSLPAYAGLVTTEQMLQEQLRELDRASLISELDRKEVREQLIDYGVDPEDAKARIAALSDAQIAELKAGIGDLPAGSGVGEVLVILLLVLLILEIAGVTDVFTFIKPVN
jgi:hypothetical protein